MIFVELYNSGSISSENIIIEIEDSEGFRLNSNATIPAGEKKVFEFEWGIVHTGKQQINVSFYPSNPDALPEEYNSGSDIFYIDIENGGGEATSTPGFEVIMILLAIALIIFRKNKKLS